MLRLNFRLLNSTALTHMGLVMAGLVLGGGEAQALPQNGSVVGGSATISQTSATQLDVTQTSSRAVLDWQSFSIGAGETTNFHQPNSSSVAVNRVTGVDPSTISGHLNANGQVVLVNPNGILFSQGASVNVGGLVATTTGISTENAMAGNFVFDQPSASSNATVVNRGKITAAQGGLVALVAPGVANSGVIRAKLGKVSLASGNAWTLDLYGDNLVNFAVNNGAVTKDVTGPDNTHAGVSNSGKIIASAGTVEITANVAKGIVTNAINMSGIVEASGVHAEGGTIVLDGGKNGVAVSGALKANGTSGGSIRLAGDTITQSGTISATGSQAGGGTVKIDAASVYSANHAGISVSGLTGGGSLSLHAGKSLTATNTTVHADARASGTGGQVKIWSDGNTNFQGTISAKGGSIAGDGGTVETSGETLSFDQTHVDTTAAHGATGTWLLDPYDLTINTADGTSIGTALATSNITLQTTSAATGTSAYGTVTNNGNGDIIDNGAISWSSANTLTLSAYRNISVGAAISNTGSGNIVLRADNTGNGTGTVGITGSVTVGGTASLYYDPSSYTAPTVYAANKFHGTSGTGAYMLVDTAAKLASVSTNLAGTYALGANIATVGTISPLGTSATPFTGTFDGNGGIATYTLGGVTASGTANAGLFGYNTGTIRNVTVTSGTVSAPAVTVTGGSGTSITTNIGGLVGYNSGQLTNDSFTGTISAPGVTVSGATGALVTSNIGGLVGYNSGQLTNDSSTETISVPTGTITGGTGSSITTNIGGLVGYSGFAQGNGTVTATTSVATISGGLVGATTVFSLGTTAINVGGLVGYNDAGSTINGGTASETVTGNLAVGGYVGYNGGLIENVTATNNVTGGSAANTLGGLVGYNAGTILSSAARNTVSAGDSVNFIGGLVGVDNGYISGASATGAVTVGNNGGTIGGFAGYEYGNSTGIYVNSTVSAGTGSAAVGGYAGYLQYGATGVTVLGKIIVGSASSYIGGLAGYAFNMDTTGPTSASISNVSVSSTILAGDSSDFIGGILAFADTFQTSLTLSGVTFSGGITLGTGIQFTGGLIGYASGVTITNGLVSGNLSVGANGLGVGGLDGYNTSNGNMNGSGQITNGTVSGAISAGAGSQYVGGLVGYNDLGGTVSDGTVSGNITSNLSAGTGGQLIGGLIGYNADTLTNGTVLASTTITALGSTGTGGLVGNNSSGGVINGGTFKGTVAAGSASAQIGGIAGYNGGTIADGTVAASAFIGTSGGTGIGGLVGYNNSGSTVSGGTVLGTVSAGPGSNQVGGLLGYNNGVIAGGIVSATASLLSASDTAVGGLIGYNDNVGLVISGFAQEAVTGGTNQVGGYIGYNDGMVVGVSVTNTVSLGTAAQNVGGAVGYNLALVSNVSATQSVSAGAGVIALGGLVGYNGGTVTGGSVTSSVTAGANAYYVGGGVGWNDAGGTVAGLVANAGVTAGSAAVAVGGIVGLNGSDAAHNTAAGSFSTVAAVISGSSFVGTVTVGASSTYIGGLAGLNAGYTSANSGTGTTYYGTVTASTGSGTVLAGSNSLRTATAGQIGCDQSQGCTPVVAGNILYVTVTAGQSKVYGAADPTFTYSATGFQNGDSSSGITGSLSRVTGVNVGTYTITEGSLADSGYTISYTGSYFSITPAPLTITASNTSRTYGASNPTFSASYNGLVAGDTASVVSGLTLSTSATNTSNVGTYGISAAGATASNYSITFASGTLSVTPASLTIAAQNASRTYGASNPAFTASYNGLVAGNTSSVVSGLTLGTTATTGSSVGSYAITGSGAAASNYTITYTAGTLTVGQASLTIAAQNASRTYGASNPAFTASYTGLVAGDTSSVVSGLTLASAATTASSVGSYTITGSGASASNYSLTYTAGTLTIGQASLTIAAQNASRSYGASNPAFTASYTGLVAGDTSSVVSGLTLASSATTASNVGSYAITGSGAAASNYSLTYTAGTLAVNPAALTITAQNTNRTYGASNPAFTASYTGLVNGNTSSVVSGLTLATSATTASSVGSYAIAGTGATAANYTITEVNGTLTVGQAALTIIAQNNSRTYGASNPAFTASYNGLVAGDTSSVVSGLTLASAATSASSVGSYAITGSSAAASNYNITYTAGTLTVGQASLTVAAQNASRAYGASNPAFTASYSGFVNGDTSSVVSGLTLASTATTASNVGSYAIIGSGAAASNYSLTYTAGTLAVNPAALTITAQNANRTYGASNPAFTASYTGLVNGNTSSVVSGLTLATSATTASSVGSYAITTTGATASNYTITQVNGTLTVGQAALTITAQNASRSYGATNPAFTASYNGLVAGDTSAVVSGLTLSTAATTASGIGSYAISALGASASNYAISLVNGTLAVGQAALTITAQNASRLYGATNPTFSASYNGLVAGDTSSVVSGLTLSTAATTASNVGSYAISALGASASNYAITLANGTLAVTPASLTIAANNASRTYGSTNPAFTAGYTGLVAGNTSSVVSGLVLGTTATTGSSVGSYAITGSGATASNYTITYTGGTLTIGQAALTITAQNASRLYGATNPNFTASYNGLVAGDTSAVVSGLTLASAATTGSNVGTYAITALGASASNYAITQVNGSLAITPAPLTVTANNTGRLYGATNPTFTATYNGLVAGDTSAVVSGLTLTTPATTASAVGTYAINAANGVASNYTLSFVPGTLTIGNSVLTITATTGQTKVYGAADPTFTYTASGFINGDTSSSISGSLSRDTGTGVGTYAITQGSISDSNYIISYVGSSFTITPAPLTITASNTSRTYGATNPAFTASYSGLVAGDTSAVVSGLTLASAATTGSNVGSYSITAAGGSAANYTITAMAGTLSVTPASLTIAAQNASRTYGASNPAFTASYNGLVAGNTSTVVSGLTLASAATTASGVGSYAINGSGATASNYTITYTAGTLAVGQASLTIASQNATRTYGASNPAFTASYNGLLNGDTSSVVSGLTLTSAATTAGVGSYAITGAGATAANYAVSYTNGTLSITPAALTVSANNAGRLYGATNPTFTASYTGLVAGDTSSVVSGLTLTTPATTASAIGTYAINAANGVASNYTLSFTPGTLTIGQGILTVTATSGQTKTYGAVDPTFTYTASGFTNGDTSAGITGSLGRATGTGVGTYAITQGSLSDTNYVISYVGSSFTITPAPLTITAGNATRTYGTSNPAFSASYSGLVAGDTSSVVSGLTLASAATTAASVGTYAIGGSGASASNYAISYINGSLAVTPAALTITASNTGRTYGAANPVFTASYNGLTAGDTSGVVSGLTLATSATTGSNIGTYGITATGATASNYAISFVNGSLSIGQAALTITANNTGRTYGSSNPAFTASYNGLTAGDTSSVVSGLSLASSATTGSGVGSYAITALGATATNYAVTLVNGTLAVTPAALLITAANTSRTYGASNPTFTATYGGLVNGDSSSVVTSLSLATAATTASNVGSYAITGTGGVASNYSITYGTGTLAINPASLLITTNNASRTYGSANPAFTVSYTGLTAGNTSSVVSGLAFNTAATSASNVGAYGVTAANATAANYTIAYVGGTLTVNPAPLTITANNASRLYTDSDPAFTTSYSGLVLGQTSSVVSGLQISANDPNNASAGSNWTITPSGATAANYSINYATGNLFIGKAYLTITPVDSSRLYGSANPGFSATYTGLQNGDTVSGLTYSTAASLASGVGQYQVNGGNATATDYIILYQPGTLNVIPAPLTIIANNVSRAQNQPEPAFTANYTGLLNGDTPASLPGLSFSAADQPNSAPGSYMLTPFGAIDANYAITYVAGVLTITPGTQGSSPSAANQAVIQASGGTGSTILAQAVNAQIFETPISMSSFNSGRDTGSNQTATQALIQNFIYANSQYLGNSRNGSDPDDQALCLKNTGGAGCSAPLMLHGF